MQKKLTGRKIYPVEFKLLNQCVECGYADHITYGDKCENCKLLNRKKCSYCEVVLRTEKEKITYAYDNNDLLRDSKDFKANKHIIHEFEITSEVIHSPKFDNLCHQCYDIQERIREDYKHYYCVRCGSGLVENPTPEEIINYLGKNGMYCKNCMYDMFQELF